MAVHGAGLIEHRDFTDAQLNTFRRHQATSFAVLAEVAAQLTPGVTERDATRWAMKAFRREGADRYFHLPVALFGERTTLPGEWTLESFFPTDHVLAAGDAVVLDASPIFDGFVVDTSMSFSVGPSAEHDMAMVDDLVYRDTILAAVRAGATFSEIAATVDDDMTGRGDRNCHQLHPEAVLGHRAVRITDTSVAPPADPSGFDALVIGWFIEGITAAMTRGEPSPTWNARSTSDHRPAPGLWAVEPHLGRGDVGVKWEELLVIDENDAYWLDDDVPHLH
ncbi:MAG: aminopeptidase P family protein [Acidimicrobiia bacterium]|nr:aminopeptidase P family protein [Acidimicrobiia bacterium]